MYVNNVQQNKSLNGIKIYFNPFVHIFICLYVISKALSFFVLHLCMSCFLRLFSQNPPGKPWTQRPMGNNVTTQLPWQRHRGHSRV